MVSIKTIVIVNWKGILLVIMLWREEYKRILENTIVPSILLNTENERLFLPLCSVVQHKLPIKLYRFRCCNERHLSALLNDEIWFANGSEMNDDFDARLYFNKEQIVRSIKEQMGDDGELNVFKMLRELNSLPTDIVNSIPDAEQTFMKLKDMSKNQTKLVSEQLIGSVLGQLDSQLKMIVDKIQKMSQFACLSENYNKDVMWGVYSDSATGFAVEYTFEQMSYKIHDNTTTINLFPVVYSNERFDATGYAKGLFQRSLISSVANGQGISFSPQFMSTYIESIDCFMPYKIALHKSNDWRREKEWRLFYTTTRTGALETKHNKVTYSPSAIYLGRKISSFNQKIITDIAKDKNLPVYKMALNDNTNSYGLKRIRVM